MSQYLMRARIGMQGFTVFVMALGTMKAASHMSHQKQPQPQPRSNSTQSTTTSQSQSQDSEPNNQTE
jgi:hypothetical protein